MFKVIYQIVLDSSSETSDTIILPTRYRNTVQFSNERYDTCTNVVVNQALTYLKWKYWPHENK